MSTFRIILSLSLIICVSAHKRGNNANIGEDIHISISNDPITDYTYTFDYDFLAPPVIKIGTPMKVSDIEKPVLISVYQEYRVISWQLPEEITQNDFIYRYTTTSRILCFDEVDYTELASRSFSVSLSTASERPVTIVLRVDPHANHNVSLDENVRASFSASEPIYFSVDAQNMADTNTMIIDVNTDSQYGCYLVSIQDRKCPIRMSLQDINSEGFYQTVSELGGLIIPTNKYNDGFVVVLVSKPNLDDCSYKRPKGIARESAQTAVTFKVMRGKTRDEYIEITMITLACILGAFIFFLIVTAVFFHCGRHHGVDVDDDEVDRVFSFKAISLRRRKFSVNDFSQKKVYNEKREVNYFWQTFTIGIFYAIPVTQLMIFYQATLDISGNLDMCYYNFQCSYPLYFKDFNHIYSNIGYIFFGVLFIVIALFKSKRMRNLPGCGIPKYHGLYYAMGFCVICEGILSACYHICPNQSNFQFDTTFMYIIVVLVCTKIYQNRHPDIGGNAYSIFSLVGIIIILSTSGLLTESTIVFAIFIVFYVVFCLFISLRIYYYDRISKGLTNFYKSLKHSTRHDLGDNLTPFRKGEFAMLLFVNCVNYILLALGFVWYPDNVNFGTFLLALFLCNGVLYATYYVVSKLVHKEKLCVETIFYLILGIGTWAGSMYFFSSGVTSWGVSPATSRSYNEECIVAEFYDSHDIWHFLSAPALFFTFMFLQTLDDDLFDVPSEKIRCF